MVFLSLSLLLFHHESHKLAFIRSVLKGVNGRPSRMNGRGVAIRFLPGNASTIQHTPTTFILNDTNVEYHGYKYTRGRTVH
jgi:hypothetical protein